MAPQPKISVVMAVHNGSAYLAAAIDSILAQDFADFELVVVDDASSDGTPEILSAFARTTSKIRLLRNDENLGLTRSLNIALKEARGSYVARLDADDLCRPGRFARQFSFMESRPAVIISGSGYRIIDAEGRTKGNVLVGLNHRQIIWLLGFAPPAFHPTFFFRRLLPDGTPVLYDEKFTTAQDYDLWSRLSVAGETAVISDATIDYRRHDQGISVVRKAEQSQFAAEIAQRNLYARLPERIVDALRPLSELLAYRGLAKGPEINLAISGMRRLLAHDRDFFDTKADRRWQRKMAAAILADAVLVRGRALTRPRDTVRFLLLAADFLPALVVIAFERRATVRKALGRLFVKDFA